MAALILLPAADGAFYGTTPGTGFDPNNGGTIYHVTQDGTFGSLHTFTSREGTTPQAALVQGDDGNFYGAAAFAGVSSNNGTIFRFSPDGGPVHSVFFTGETALDNGVYYLGFPGGNVFGLYSYLSDSRYVYHFDLGYEYVFDAYDGQPGVYLYDFKSQDFFYTSPVFPFPYLYDFNLGSVVYYYPDPNNPGRYNTNSTRYFYVYRTGQIISK